MNIIQLETDKLFTDISDQINDILREHDGDIRMVNIYSPHTTMKLDIIEYELLSMADIRFKLDEFAPISKEQEGRQRNTKYLHDLISLRNDVPVDERVNGHSHIRGLLFNASLIIPVKDNTLYIGEWQSIVAVELDPIRKREIYVSVI